ncbi:TetR/AcrR family transcriptional regulator [Microbacterium bovistercoris]|uniref:TetR/AcrR family transcriptional regulator n=1 Tax=Microbacterium bovistercoris TaxID=2293570 RepID=A0A371NTT0_9MICO|nr:TetR/AcrR family transcriptional regulator C-terminal domain-containing protein [Microbacterium bovistercoris]REJ05671.1 TetR/AcrR family transcriptional regulator [Microbacterium bovistercoris]
MPRPLIDLLWRDAPDAPSGGSRGPRPKHSVGDVVDRAIVLADDLGLAGLTVRALADSLGMTTMSVYTHVGSRDDLLVLMADRAHAHMTVTPFSAARWRARVRTVADDNLALIRRHPWLLDVHDSRTALGPGTIAKYDRELHAFDGADADDIARDAALSFMLDFVRAAAARIVRMPDDAAFGEAWEQSAGSLTRYLGDDFPLARRVGAAAGEAMGAPYDAQRAWEFGLDRVIAGLADLDA